jgi:hypothetical protein
MAVPPGEHHAPIETFHDLFRRLLLNHGSGWRVAIRINNRCNQAAFPTCPRSRALPRFRSSGHSVGFPVRLDLSVPTGKLGPNGTTLIDFIITNIGAEPIKIPSSVDQNITHTHTLTLYLTLDGIGSGHFNQGETFSFQPTSAELYGQSSDLKTFYLLAPSKAIQVHASTRFALNPGTHSLTAHPEFVKLSEGSSEMSGTAESGSLEKVFSATGAAGR